MSVDTDIENIKLEMGKDHCVT